MARVLIPYIIIVLVGLLAFATIHDAALGVAPYLNPWFGWMKP